MLPVPKEETRPEMAAADPPTPAVGFGKVLTSIQGLQRRLDDFSIEDVSEAEANAKTLIQKISLLQGKLIGLTEMKQFVSAANRSVSEIPEESYEQVDMHGLENHPQLHAIIQASKLIRLHRMMRAAKAGVESVTFDALAGTLSFAPSAQLVDVSSLEAILPSTSLNQELPSSLAEPLARPKEEEIQTGEADSVSRSEDAETSPDERWVLTSETEPVAAQHPFSQIDDLEFVDRQSVEHDQTEHLNVQERIEDRKTYKDDKNSSKVAEASFDKRLLNDLIEAYGEFVITPQRTESLDPSTAANPTLPAAVESPAAPTEIAIVVEEPSSTVTSEQAKSTEIPTLPALSAAPTPIQTKLAEVRETGSAAAAKSPKRKKSKFAKSQTLPATIEAAKPVNAIASEIQALPAPIVEKPIPVVEEQKKIPNVRKHSELDRQLKSIIKDYGEYDLYSHPSSTKVKTAAIVAFALLGLVLGGFYFFKAPAHVATAPVSAITELPSQSTSKPNASLGAKALEAGEPTVGGGSGESGEHGSKTTKNKTK